jgi:hypothetical protein
VAVVFVVGWLAAWHQHIPLTSSGKDCGARVYSFGPGMAFDPSEGSQSRAEIDQKSAECRRAASTYWWTGSAFLVLGVGATAVGFGLRRRP